MRKLENAIIATILILFAQPVHAGVIMSETEVRSGLGDSTTINKTVYVQGKKQKIETSHDEKIIDLEKRVVYEIHPNRKSYVRRAFPPKREREVAGASIKLSAVTLKKTGRSRSIDGYSCEEYRGIGRLDVMDVTVHQCMSRDAPGARELANFQKEVASILKGRRAADSADSSKEGMPLEQSSSIKPRREVIIAAVVISALAGCGTSSNQAPVATANVNCCSSGRAVESATGSGQTFADASVIGAGGSE
jgi:hypothetical protein